MTVQTQNAVQIQIVSDVVCPWCIIGYKQLEKALQETGISADITWHPFELNPNMPAEGQNLREHIMEKYGSTRQQSDDARDQMLQVGADVGFEFNFADDMRMHNTFLAHQLLHWAKSQGKQHELQLELFSTHFTHRRNLGDIEMLANAAQVVGLDRTEALAVLTDGRFVKEVRNEQQLWRGRGINSVPASVFNQSHLVSGAQGEESFAALLRAISEETSVLK